MDNYSNHNIFTLKPILLSRHCDYKFCVRSGIYLNLSRSTFFFSFLPGVINVWGGGSAIGKSPQGVVGLPPFHQLGPFPITQSSPGITDQILKCICPKLQKIFVQIANKYLSTISPIGHHYTVVPGNY